MTAGPIPHYASVPAPRRKLRDTSVRPRPSHPDDDRYSDPSGDEAEARELAWARADRLRDYTPAACLPENQRAASVTQLRPEAAPVERKVA